MSSFIFFSIFSLVQTEFALVVFFYNFFMYLINVGKSLEIERPKFADCRSLLRSGPAASLRVNIRAVSQAFFVYFLFL